MKKLREICIHLMVWMIDLIFSFFKMDWKWKKQESSHMYNVIFFTYTNSLLTATVLNNEFGELVITI